MKKNCTTFSNKGKRGVITEEPLRSEKGKVLYRKGREEEKASLQKRESLCGLLSNGAKKDPIAIQ